MRGSEDLGLIARIDKNKPSPRVLLITEGALVVADGCYRICAV
jgi:hypothetical protein